MSVYINICLYMYLCVCVYIYMLDNSLFSNNICVCVYVYSVTGENHFCTCHTELS